MGWLDEVINFDGDTNGDLLLNTLEDLADAIKELNEQLKEAIKKDDS